MMPFFCIHILQGSRPIATCLKRGAIFEHEFVANLLPSRVELGRYRFFKSVSVFGFLVGFFKCRYRFRYRFFKISRYRFRFSVFLHEPTIAYRITPSLTPYALPFPPNGVWALEFALQIAAIRDSDIVTIDNL